MAASLAFMPLQIGQTIDGKYRIVRLIGEGGMGAVYEGENTRIRRKVAIKLLHGAIAENAEMVQRFEREAQVAGTVGNDHILEILDLGALPNGDRYMVMEFLEGETLTDRIKARTRLTPRDAAMIARQMLAGLAAAHGAGIVHRDLKPDNIFILRSKAGVRDFVKIIDFGISKFSEQGATSRMTRTGALMGTPHYMAPEQATGSAEIDRRTDIYAVGIILYEMVTGRVPFQAETFNQLLFEIALAKIIPARQVVPDLDPAFESIIMKASARDPGHRFQTCEEFAQAIEEWETTGAPVSLPPEQSIEAIVARTVPRTAPMPSQSGAEAASAPLTASQARQVTGSTGMPSGGGVLSGSIASAPAMTAPAGTVQPTVNSWSNSQAGVVPVQNPPVLAATVLGVLLLVGGGVGAYFVLRPAPAPAAAVASAPAAASDVAPAAAAPKTAEAPAVAPAPAQTASAAPSVPATAKAAVLPTPRPAPRPAQIAAKPAPPPAEKPKAKKSINFGY